MAGTASHILALLARFGLNSGAFRHARSEAVQVAVYLEPQWVIALNAGIDGGINPGLDLQRHAANQFCARYREQLRSDALADASALSRAAAASGVMSL